MKKFFVYFAALAAMFLMISCGGGSNNSSSNSCPYEDEYYYECRSGDESWVCDEGTWYHDDDCENGCNEETGQCYHEDSGTNNDETSDGTDTGSDETDTGSDGTDTGNINPAGEGIYFGIIGFNEYQYTKEIGLLDNSTVYSYTSFIDDLTPSNGTGLYFADYTALEKMRNYPKPSELKKVALVTFTDGLDNISLANDDYNPGNYSSTAAYGDALHDMIVKEKIHGLNVEAYTIGLKGNDVTDDAQFTETLKKLASNDKNVFQVSDMDEAMKHFNKIAKELYSVSKTEKLDVKVPGGYDDRQLLRFTFDNPSAATNSQLYIEATFRRDTGRRNLEEITYHGLAQGRTAMSSVSSEGAYYHFEFENLKYDDGKTPLSQSDISRIMLWKETSTGGWDRESEFDPESSSIVTEDKDSALIMLVLDCTTSLGSDFSNMKQAGKDFVTTLVNGGNGSNTDSDYDYPDTGDSDYDDDDYSDDDYTPTCKEVAGISGLECEECKSDSSAYLCYEGNSYKCSSLFGSMGIAELDTACDWGCDYETGTCF
jgi:hypothetical protein